MEKELIKIAKRAQKNAFSKTKKVGSAILTKSGHIYSGCNVQSVISGLGVCAERNAIYSACANGEYEFAKVYVYPDSDSIKGPCGACLQEIYEFASYSKIDTEIVCLNSKGKVVKRSNISKLLPFKYP